MSLFAPVVGLGSVVAVGSGVGSGVSVGGGVSVGAGVAVGAQVAEGNTVGVGVGEAAVLHADSNTTITIAKNTATNLIILTIDIIISSLLSRLVRIMY